MHIYIHIILKRTLISKKNEGQTREGSQDQPVKLKE